jgi:hypothetical protein
MSGTRTRLLKNRFAVRTNARLASSGSWRRREERWLESNASRRCEGKVSRKIAGLGRLRWRRPDAGNPPGAAATKQDQDTKALPGRAGCRQMRRRLFRAWRAGRSNTRATDISRELTADVARPTRLRNSSPRSKAGQKPSRHCWPITADTTWPEPATARRRSGTAKKRVAVQAVFLRAAAWPYD